MVDGDRSVRGDVINAASVPALSTPVLAAEIPWWADREPGSDAEKACCAAAMGCVNEVAADWMKASAAETAPS